MIILWTLLVSLVSAQKVLESTEDIGPEAFQNITTLYPITNINNLNKTLHKNNTNSHVESNKVNNDTGKNRSKNNDKPKSAATVWKIEAAFAESNLDKQKENSTEVTTDKNNETEPFRPSPHLGNFYEEDSPQVTPTKASFGSFGSFTPVRRPSAGFVSSTKDEFHSSFTKIPKQMLQTHKQYPYKFERPILTRVKDHWRNQEVEDDKPSWRDRPDSLESRPTAEVPVKVPAGGFYKYEDPFKEKGKDDEDFGLSFNEDGKDIAVKNRVNPWEHFLRLVTAFLPVGLIISALTPSIITIENTGPGPQNHFPSNVFRRSDPEHPGHPEHPEHLEQPAHPGHPGSPGAANTGNLGMAELPVISEKCRRRLLCELHSDNNYKQSQNAGPRRGKQCYKIHCDEPAALARTLRWLLDYRHKQHNGR